MLVLLFCALTAITTPGKKAAVKEGVVDPVARMLVSTDERVLLNAIKLITCIAEGEPSTPLLVLAPLVVAEIPKMLQSLIDLGWSSIFHGKIEMI